MNWFERHLNWTALFLLVFNVLIFFFFARVTPGMNDLLYVSILNISSQTMLLLAIFLVCWLIFLASGYSWVLFQKNRSPWFLFFFVPTILVILAGLVYKLSYFSNIDIGFAYGDPIPSITPAIQTLIISFGLLILAAGWLTLLLLKKKQYSPKSDNTQRENNVISGSRFFHRIFGSKTRIRNTGCSTIALSVFFSIIIILFLHYGHITYRTPKAYASEFPEISFKYPAFYNEPIYHRVKYYDQSYYGQYIILFDSINNSHISIEFQTLSVNQTEIELLNDFENRLLKDFNNPPEYQQIARSTSTVGEIPSYQFAVSVKTDFNNDIDWNDFGSNIYNYFIYKERLWIISYHSSNKADTQPPAYFTHLLESLKFIDK